MELGVYDNEIILFKKRLAIIIEIMLILLVLDYVYHLTNGMYQAYLASPY